MNIQKITFIAVLAILLGASTPDLIAGSSRWRPFGIGGGGYTCAVTYDPSDKCGIITGSDVTGNFKTTDNGRNWRSALRGLSNYYIRYILIHPDDPDILFACTGAGLSRSTDGGETWVTSLELPLHGQEAYAAGFSHAIIDPIDPDVVWAGVGSFRYSDVAGPGGDDEGEYPHVWRSDALGEPGSWEPVNSGGPAGGPAPDCGIHTIIPLPYNWDDGNPGSEMFITSTTDSVWMCFYDVLDSSWIWVPRQGAAPARLPHGDARDLEALWNEGGDLQRLYVVLNSIWDISDSSSAMSIYNDSLGYGGGVWYSDDIGAHWFPTSFASGEDSLHLEDGYVDSRNIHYPKNMRHLAIDRENGRLYVGLTFRSMATEGIWATDPSSPGWLWRRITESRDYGSWPLNIEYGYFHTLGKVDGLAVNHETGDVVFNTSMGIYRCRQGDCLPGDSLAGTWENLSSRVENTDPLTYRTKGMDVTQVFGVMVSPADTSVWYQSVGDIGLLRSDDGGISWRQVMDTDSLPYTEYGSRNARGVYFIPDSPDLEVLAVFGWWHAPARFGLWSTAGLPDTSSSWHQVEGLPYYSIVNDVEFLTGDTMLVGTNYGVYRGTRPAGGKWQLVPDMPGVPADTSCYVNDVLVAPGNGTNRRMIIALGRYDQKPGGIYYRDNLSEPWEQSSYLSGPVHGMEDVQALCMSKIDTAIVYAGNASRQFGESESAGVLKSTDGGRNWFMTSQEMADYAADTYDVVGIATLLSPVPGEETERVYAALLPDDEPPDRESTFGGVFVSTDGGGTWEARSEGLAAGHGIFLSDDSTNPSRLFFGTFGNGAFLLVEDFGLSPAGTGRQTADPPPHSSETFPQECLP